MGHPSPPVAYTDAEHATWRTVHTALEPALRAHACQEILDAREEACIPADRIPQHTEVGAVLKARTEFDFTLAGGFVNNRRFFESLGRGFFHAVQFVRHPAVPLYTPEPDVIHDVFGHGVHLVSPRFADLYRLIGRTAQRLHTKEALELLSRVYWYTLEFGVLTQTGHVKAYGAALLSSYGEIRKLPQCEIRAWNVCAMAKTPYRAAGYQPFLFATRSLNHLTDALTAFCEAFDDDTGPRLGLRPVSSPHPPISCPTGPSEPRNASSPPSTSR